jgi:hypothetical protein
LDKALLRRYAVPLRIRVSHDKDLKPRGVPYSLWISEPALVAFISHVLTALIAKNRDSFADPAQGKHLDPAYVYRPSGGRYILT